MRLNTWLCERVMTACYWKVLRANTVKFFKHSISWFSLMSAPSLHSQLLCSLAPTFLHASFQPKQPNLRVLLIAYCYWRVESWSTITAQGKQEIASHLISDTICHRNSSLVFLHRIYPSYASTVPPRCPPHILHAHPPSLPVSWAASSSFLLLGNNLFVLPWRSRVWGVHHSHFIQTIRNASKLK